MKVPHTSSKLGCMTHHAKLHIQWPTGEAIAILTDTPTTRALLDILPVSSLAQTWGDEVYFSVPMHVELEADAEQVVPPGTVGFWTEGDCIAIPFGPTPISEGDECRLAARVNILGRLQGDARALETVQAGDRLTLSLKDQG